MKFEKKIKNMKVKEKLGFYRTVAIAIVIFLGIVSAALSILMYTQTKKITDVWSPSLYCVQRMNTLTSDYRMKQYGHLVATTPAEMKRYDDELSEIETQLNEITERFSGLIETATEKEMYADLSVKWDAYRQKSELVIQKSREQKVVEGAELMIGEVYDVYQDFGNTFNELLAFEQDELNKAKDVVEVVFILVLVAILFVILLSILITTKLGKVVTKMITEPVEQITKAAEGMRQGNMSAGQNIKYESKDELGVVAKSLREAMKILSDYIEEISGNLREIAKGDLTKDSDEITNFLGDFESIKESFVYILKKFNATLSEIHDTSDQVATSAEQLASSSRALSDGATDQASAIEELSATIVTVSGLAEESAKNTQEAYDRMRISADKAEHEKERMTELIEEMSRITEISKEIENIITAIEDIASQTNLLSLNASIEAARAGEAGRGFAVVADQIGKLASDSAQSAVNTRELIRKTLEEIEKGNMITDSVSETFANVIEEMSFFAEGAQKINENVNNQASALEQIEQGIEQISVIMQNTAASSEESTAISENLSEGAQKLDELVRRFKLYE